jgi:hypothetical protein
MIDPTALAGIRVEGFWRNFNWFGFAELDEPAAPIPAKPKDWLECSVTEFLERANWSGKVALELSPSPLRSREPLSLSVEEYFGSLPWWGESGATPPRKRIPAPPSSLPPKPTRDFNATDLSNLF